MMMGMSMMSMSMMMGMIMVSNMTMIWMMIIMNVDMIWRTIIHYDKFILPMNAIHHAITVLG